MNLVFTRIYVAGSSSQHFGYSYGSQDIHAIQAMLPPTNVKQVHQFLGICNYYRKFILDFAKMSQPIAELVKKDTPFIWSVACNEAFLKLKSMLLRFPILRQPDHGKPFYIYTDAYGYALGAILSQFDDESNEYVCQPVCFTAVKRRRNSLWHHRKRMSSCYLGL